MPRPVTVCGQWETKRDGGTGIRVDRTDSPEICIFKYRDITSYCCVLKTTATFSHLFDQQGQMEISIRFLSRSLSMPKKLAYNNKNGSFLQGASESDENSNSSTRRRRRVENNLLLASKTLSFENSTDDDENSTGFGVVGPTTRKQWSEWVAKPKSPTGSTDSHGTREKENEVCVHRTFSFNRCQNLEKLQPKRKSCHP